jgi:hypothetical protein
MQKNKRKDDRLQAISLLLRKLKNLVKGGFISETKATEILSSNLDVQMKLHLGRDV